MQFLEDLEYTNSHEARAMSTSKCEVLADTKKEVRTLQVTVVPQSIFFFPPGCYSTCQRCFQRFLFKCLSQQRAGDCKSEGTQRADTTNIGGRFFGRTSRFLLKLRDSLHISLRIRRVPMHSRFPRHALQLLKGFTKIRFLHS